MKRSPARRGSPSLERALALSGEGSVVEAIEELERLLRRSPSADLLLQKAVFHLQRRNYAGAAADLDAAERLAPGDGRVLARRAELYVMTDRLAEARAEYDRALAAAPADEHLRLARLRVLVQQDEGDAEIAALSKEGSEPGRLEARLCAGQLALKRGRHAEAEKLLRGLFETLPEDDPVSMRARFYWTASRAVDPGFRRRNGMDGKQDKKRLYLCGLGIFPPYTASLEVLHALSRCDVLFNNVAGPETRQLLAEFCPDIRPASYQAWQDEPKWADRIFDELDKGKTVAFVTRGHPLVFGGLAVELLRRCKAQNVEHQTFGAVSSIDHLLAFAGKGLGDDFGGIQAMDRPAVLRAESMNTALPLLACFYGGMEDKKTVAEFRRSLERFYPSSHLCWMFGPKYDANPATVAVGELERAYPEVHASLMLYVPPLAPEQKRAASAKSRRR